MLGLGNTEKDYDIDFSSLSFSLLSLAPPFIYIIPLPVRLRVRVSTMHRLPRTRYRDDEPAVPSRVIIFVDVTSGIIQSTPVTFPTKESPYSFKQSKRAKSIVLPFRGNYQRSSASDEETRDDTRIFFPREINTAERRIVFFASKRTAKHTRARGSKGSIFRSDVASRS